MLPLTRIFMANPLFRIKYCFYILSLFSLVVILATVFVTVNNNFRPRLRRPGIRYDHLQPLREMFTNASRVKDIGQRSNLEGTGQTKVTLSDLQEVNNKVSVLLLVIVSTAPSRYERREAIRATWWKNCDGTEVSFVRYSVYLSAIYVLGEGESRKEVLRYAQDISYPEDDNLVPRVSLLPAVVKTTPLRKLGTQ